MWDKARRILYLSLIHILDVYTNGTLEPDEAVSLAAKVLSEDLSLFIDLSEAAQQADVMIEKEDNAKEKVLEMRCV